VIRSARMLRALRAVGRWFRDRWALRDLRRKQRAALRRQRDDDPNIYPLT
jgi:hypothetical protein